MFQSLDELESWAAASARLWIFLDYDGTLAEFCPTPAILERNSEVIRLVANLSARPRFRIAVISGRQLSAVDQLLPVESIFHAGVYGVEIRPPRAEAILRASLDLLRPALESIKPRWEKLLDAHAGFFLEDKGWALALHAREVEPAFSGRLLALARSMAEDDLPPGLFRWFSHPHFLEVAPLQAHKGQAVRYLLGHFPFPASRILYIGDDDKDQEAFETVHAFGGRTVLVYNPDHPDTTGAVDFSMDSPAAVRRFLTTLLHQNLI